MADQVAAVVDVIGDYSPDMKKMLDYYQLVDALNDGIDAMRKGRTMFLPKFPDENNDDYIFRLSQTKMTNVFSDIIESLAAKCFEEEIKLDGDPDTHDPFLADFVKDVDGSGQSMNMFSMDVMEAGIRSAIDWIFIDYPVVDTSQRMSVQQKKDARIRPFWSRIIAVNVLEAKSVMFGGTEQLTYFRYKEPGTPDRVRVLALNTVSNDDGSTRTNVIFTLYKKTDTYDDKKKTFYVVEESGFMDIDEIPIVPFVTGRRVGRTFELKPPMKAAADAQKDLYHQESALKYAKVLAAYPMLSGNGVKPARDEAGNIIPLGIGPQRVLYAPPNADGSVGSWKYVEPNANTLQFLAKDIETSIQNLRELGRMPLTAQTQNLTTVTTAFAAGKSKSAVSAWAGRLKGTLEHALRITAKWESIIDPVIKVFVFTEFDEFMGSEDIAELNTARSNGDISQETYWFECKRRGFLSDSFDPKKEKELLLTESPSPDDDPVTAGG